MKRIYLDNNATTPVDPRVRRVMEPYLRLEGNPSSLHQEGRRARAAIDEARDKVAALLGLRPTEVVFTGGGTESNNLAICGLALAHAHVGRHVVTCATEHHAVLESCRYLEKYHDFKITILPVNRFGELDMNDLKRALELPTAVVTIMSANNETGVKHSVQELAEACALRNVLFHTDAVQSAGKEPLSLKQSSITALSLAPHKFNGPTGIGLLCLRAGVPLVSTQHGGSQENTRRPGTEHVAGIVGLAEALVLAQGEAFEESQRLFPMVEDLWLLLSDLPGIQRNGDAGRRIANTLNVSFAGLDGEELLIGLDLAGLALSSGSACLVGSVLPSHVLQAMGVPPELAQATVRFSLGKQSKEEDLQDIAGRVREVVLHQAQIRRRPKLPLHPI